MKKSFLALLALLILVPFSYSQTRINCGGPAYTDKIGNVWQADSLFAGGQGYSVSSPISGTQDPTLYQSLRFTQSNSMMYTVPVSNGQYSVNLLFAEIYFTSAGRRVFNVKVNGVAALTNFDIFAKVGANTADIEKIPVTVTTGQIIIEFDAVMPSPQINAIDIEPAVTLPPPIQNIVTVNISATYDDGSIPTILTINVNDVTDPKNTIGQLSLTPDPSTGAAAGVFTLVNTETYQVALLVAGSQVGQTFYEGGLVLALMPQLSQANFSIVLFKASGAVKSFSSSAQ